MDGFLHLSKRTAGRLQAPFIAHRDSNLPPHASIISLLQSDDDEVCASFLGQDEDSGPFDPAAISQCLFFFGTVEVFLGTTIRYEDFVDRGAITLSKEDVYRYFRTWSQDLRRLSPSQQHSHREYLAQFLEGVLRKAEYFDSLANFWSHDDFEYDKIALSIRLLHNILQNLLQDIGRGEQKRYMRPSRLRSVLGWTGLPFASRDRNIWSMSRPERREYLNNVRKSVIPFPVGNGPNRPATRLLLRTFVQNGWCISRARQLCESFDYLECNFFASVPRVGPSTNVHVNCRQAEKCSAFQLNSQSQNYPTRHDGHDQALDCGYVAISAERVMRIINKNKIPLISIARTGEDLDLKVVEWSLWKSYTAISHVWSDGLGNAVFNGIPQCQIQRLRQLIINAQSQRPAGPPRNFDLPGSYLDHLAYVRYINSRPGKPIQLDSDDRIYFWMDTFCIPTLNQSTPTDERNIREVSKMRAIKHITPIYAGATQVLILDSSFDRLEISSNLDSPLGSINTFEDQEEENDFIAHILASTWMQRGWTLEEGAVSQRAIFQLNYGPRKMPERNGMLTLPAGCSPSLEHLAYRLRCDVPLILHRILQEDKRRLTSRAQDGKPLMLLRLLCCIPGRNMYTTNTKDVLYDLRVPTFVSSWNSLLDRTTTRPGDSFFILANLLDFVALADPRIAKDDRIPLLIRSCDILPASLLYNTGPRLCLPASPENNWIPTQVGGEKLVTGAALRFSTRSFHDPVLEFDTSQCESGTFKYLLTAASTAIPHEACQFQLTTETGLHYLVEVQAKNHTIHARPHDQAVKAVYDRSKRTCIILDLNSGTSSLQGHIARGARFSVYSHSRSEVLLTYDAPIVAWTTDQWRHQNKSPQTSFDAIELTPDVRVKLKYGECVLDPLDTDKLIMVADISYWPMHLVRRPVLTTRPVIARLAAYVTCFIIACGIFMALYMNSKWARRQNWLPLLLMGITRLLCYDVLVQLFAMYNYKRWLDTYKLDLANANASTWQIRVQSAFARCRKLTRRRRNTLTDSNAERIMLTNSETLDGQ